MVFWIIEVSFPNALQSFSITFHCQMSSWIVIHPRRQEMAFTTWFQLNSHDQACFVKYFEVKSLLSYLHKLSNGPSKTWRVVSLSKTSWYFLEVLTSLCSCFKVIGRAQDRPHLEPSIVKNKENTHTLFVSLAPARTHFRGLSWN